MLRAANKIGGEVRHFPGKDGVACLFLQMAPGEENDLPGSTLAVRSI